MDDVAPKLLEAIQRDFDKLFNDSLKLKELQKKIASKDASYVEANEFAIEVGKLLAKAYQNNLSSDVLPDGRMYYNIAKRILDPTLRNNYTLISQATLQVQKTLNENAKIGIKAIVPELDIDKIQGIINKVSNEANYDEIKWMLEEPIITFSQSIVDEAIKANANFHYDSGLKPKIIRKVAGNCCKWCLGVAGAYSYPDVPKDVYRRHQRCRCTVDYHPGDGKVQNVHSKRWRNETEIEKRKLINIESTNKNGKINVEIDEFTPCLKRLSDGKIIDTYIVKGIPSKRDLKNWEFDWSKEKEKGFVVSQLFAKGDKRIQGLIATKIRKDLSAVEVDLVESAPFNNPHNSLFRTKEYSGVGPHLFAEAVRQSYDAGFDGFVTFVAKTNLIEYYKKELGASQVANTQKMFIDERNAKKLYEKYFKK